MMWRYYARMIVVGCMLTASCRVFSETITVDAEEYKRLAGEVADLREANVALQRRMTQLETKTEALQTALREANEQAVQSLATVATRDDLARMSEKLKELDGKREADRKLILEQFEKLSATLTAPAETPRGHKKAQEAEAASALAGKPLEGKFLTYKVQPGDMLEKVLKAYNQNLKKDGRPTINAEQVQAANPGLNPNNLLAGKNILLPVPDKKDQAEAPKQ